MLTRRHALKLAAGLVAAGAVPTATASAKVAPEPGEPGEPMEAVALMALWPSGYGGAHHNREVVLRVDARGGGAIELRRPQPDPDAPASPIATMEADADTLRRFVTLFAA